MRRSIYTDDEGHAVRAALARGERPRCPRCGRLLEAHPVAPRADVAYVRRRTLYLCGACGAGVAVDRPPADRDA